jgi:cytochrome P450
MSVSPAPTPVHVCAEDLTADDVLGPDRFAEHGYPHEAWRALRREPRLCWFELPGGRRGFWAVTRRDDVVWFSKQPQRFHNAPRLAVFPDSPPRRGDGPILRHLLNMDPPDHAPCRRLASAFFTPRAIGRLRPEIERVTRELVDAMAARDECDFVADFTAPLTLSVLASMLGIPRELWRRLFHWTNLFAGAADPEFQLYGDAGETMRAARDEMFAYFGELAAERRARPRDDLVSVLARAELAGAPLRDFELLSYFTLLVAAGNETTRNAASGGLLALIENPRELERLRRDPRLMPSAVEEIVRFTSPVIQFCRTPIADVELRGQRIRAGESLCLLYPSANRDERVFEDPDVFRVDRRPNPHLGFGIGEHFCLGANLARLELLVMLEQLVPRLERIDLAGSFERMRSSFLGGVKRMPIRCALRPGDAR